MKHFLIFNNFVELKKKMMTFHKKIGLYLILEDIMVKLSMEYLKDGEYLFLMMEEDMKACLPIISFKVKANYLIVRVFM